MFSEGKDSEKGAAKVWPLIKHLRPLKMKFWKGLKNWQPGQKQNLLEVTE